jgi:hypothetical protein
MCSEMLLGSTAGSSTAPGSRRPSLQQLASVATSCSPSKVVTVWSAKLASCPRISGFSARTESWHRHTLTREELSFAARAVANSGAGCFSCRCRTAQRIGTPASCRSWR